MALNESAPRFTTQRLVRAGVPAFLIAGILSVATHLAAHALAREFSGSGIPLAAGPETIAGIHHLALESPIVSLAGPLWTLVLAFTVLPLFLRHPSNLFYASMVFVNASMRLPDTILLLSQLLGASGEVTRGDEVNSLLLLPLRDPSALTAIIYFYALLSLFLTLTVIHDTKVVPWKWGVALVLFAAMIPLQWVVEETLARLLG